MATTMSYIRRSHRVAYLSAAALFLVATMGPLTAAKAFAANGEPCPDVEVVFARGTFEAPGVGATGQAFVDALTNRLGGESVDVYGVNYPATLDFEAATAGIADASNRIETMAANCPDTKIVLGGYSQGAAVAGYTTFDTIPAGLTLPDNIGPMPASVSPHVAAVALFGTPDNWFLNLVDHDAPPVTVGAQYAAKTVQLCAQGDPVCFPGGLDRSAHSSYKSNGMAQQAADFVANAIAAGPTPTSAT